MLYTFLIYSSLNPFVYEMFCLTERELIEK